MNHERNLLHAQRHIRALALATECAELGARIRTMQLLTGLSPSQLQHLFRHVLCLHHDHLRLHLNQVL